MPSANTVVSSLVLNIVNIIILFAILRALVYKPVKKYMAARTEKIDERLQAADKKLSEAEEMRQQCAQTLATASKQAAEIRTEKIAEADAKADEIITAAAKQAEEIKTGAEAQAAHAADKMLDDMRSRIADLSVELAGKIMEREVKQSDNKDLIDSYFEKVIGK